MNPLYRKLLLAGLCAATFLPAAHAYAQSRAPASAVAAAASAPAADATPRDPEKEKLGANAAHAWLLLIDRRDWGTAWDASSAVFRQSVPLATWMDSIPKVREPFGNLVEREAAEAVYRTQLAGRPAGDYVTVNFMSRFDKKARVVESLTTVREADGRWRVTGYTYTEL